jgi:uncharacterized protein YxjI
MSSIVQAFFGTRDQLFIQQKKEWTEILIDWETKNRYAVMDGDRNVLGAVAERAGGFLDVLRRGFLRSHRGFEVDVLDPGGAPILNLSRKFFFFFSDLEVRSGDGRKLGSVHRRFGILYKKYDLKDESGTCFATIKSPLWRLWTFPVLDRTGNQRSTISKRWGGALREIFTDADTFMVDYGSGQWREGQKAVIFAAAISIDFDFFENNQGSDGVFGGLLGG